MSVTPTRKYQVCMYFAGSYNVVVEADDAEDAIVAAEEVYPGDPNTEIAMIDSWDVEEVSRIP